MKTRTSKRDRKCLGRFVGAALVALAFQAGAVQAELVSEDSAFGADTITRDTATGLR